MPVYEEKLISPLSVRFTQEHIKTVFRDMHVVETTVEQIEARPGVGDYDLVLHAPFPEIEITRWGAVGAEETGHWFTLDNRRLYCLQRAALKHWPLRVAAKVEILHADPKVVRRKFDSTTLGSSVTMAHSCKDAPLFRWDWRTEVLSPAKKNGKHQAAFDAIAADDHKSDVDDLAGYSEEPDSIIARALQHELLKASSIPKTQVRRSLTPSTEAYSEDSDDTPRHKTWEHAWSYEQACTDGKGHRISSDGRHDSRAMQATQGLLEITQQLRAPGSDGRLRIPNWNERYGKRLGSLRKFLEARPDTFVVIAEREGKFRVYEVDADWNDSSADWNDSSADDVVAAATSATAEIRKQLEAQGGFGNVRIDDWNGRFAQSLGPFKTFIRSRPQEFQIMPSASRFFKVALADDHRAYVRARGA